MVNTLRHLAHVAVGLHTVNVVRLHDREDTHQTGLSAPDKALPVRKRAAMSR